MNTFKTTLLTGLTLAAVVGVLVSLHSGANNTPLPAAVATSSIETGAVVAAVASRPAPVPASQAQTQATVATSSSARPAEIQAPNVTLLVGENSYATFIPAGSNVLDAMRTLASTSDFTFTGHEYPSLGFFVDSINGTKAEHSYNWMLYLNGKLSNTGASQTTLQTGDAIEWRYEKSY